MPYDRALKLLKNPNASAASLLKAYGELNMEFGHRASAEQAEAKNREKTQANSDTNFQSDCETDPSNGLEAEPETDPEHDLIRYMVAIKALELRLHQKFKRGA